MRHQTPMGYGDASIGLLVSGGLDSSILLGQLLERGRNIQPFYIRSGLIWQTAELQWLRSFLRAIAQPRLHPLMVLELPLVDLYANHWSVTGVGVPAADSPDEAVYLPGRNPLLIIKAALWCRLHGIHELALAPLASNPFADAGPEFFADFQAALNRATRGRVQLLRPFERHCKREVMWLGQVYPLARTFSCIHPYGTLHCGRCNKCHERRKAFRLIGSDDPTEYATTYCGSSPPIDVWR